MLFNQLINFLIFASNLNIYEDYLVLQNDLNISLINIQYFKVVVVLFCFIIYDLLIFVLIINNQITSV